MTKLSDMPQTETAFRASVEVCQRVGIDRSTLSRWVKDGSAVPSMRLPGKTGAYLWTDAEIDRLSVMYAERNVA